MELSPSAHVDTFARDNLPPPAEWPELSFELPELNYPERLNCAAELLDTTVERVGPDRPCVIGEAQSWTYGELQRKADQVARVLVEDLGLVPGNRVLLRGPNNPWLVACWFGVVKAGAVAVTVVPVLRSGELSDIVRAARVSHALCDARFLDDLLQVEADGLRIVSYGGGDPHGPAVNGAPDDLAVRCERKPAELTAVDTAADDVCMIAFTSGTTGRPKGCMHFHRDVLAIADTFSRHVLEPRPDDVFSGSPPLAFTFGLGGLVVFPMRAGAATVLLERASPDALLRAVAEHRVSVLFTAPTAYRAMLPEIAGADISSLRRCVSAGEHINADTCERWRHATGVAIIDGIGSTELLHIFISAAGENIRPGSTGTTVPGYVARVIDESGNPVPDGQPGFLAVRGPTGCRYLADDRQRDYVRGGWNITGDTYVRDAAGYFWYQARSDDMIISAGYNIAAIEVEEAILGSPDVAEAAVVGVPDAERGQLVKAFVVLRDGVTADEAAARALQDRVKSRIAPYKYPRTVEFRDELPRTPTGKLQRFRLRQG